MIVLIPAYEPDDRLVALVAALPAAPTSRSSSSTTAAARPTRRRSTQVRAAGRDRPRPRREPRQGRRAARPASRWLAEHAPGPRRGLRRLRRPAPGAPTSCAVAERVRGAPTPRWCSARAGSPATSRCAAGSATPSRGVLVRHRDRAARARHPDRPARLPGVAARLAAGVDGDRFEYELDLLLRASQDGVPVEEVRDRDGLPRRERVVALPAGRRLRAHLRAAAAVLAVVVRWRSSSTPWRCWRCSRSPAPCCRRCWRRARSAPPSTSSSTAGSCSPAGAPSRCGGRRAVRRARGDPARRELRHPHRADRPRRRPPAGQGRHRGRAVRRQLPAAAHGRVRGAYGTSLRAGPTYWLSGRISEFAFSCSITCAVQPVIRLATNSGVNVGVSKPMRWYAGPVG